MRARRRAIATVSSTCALARTCSKSMVSDVAHQRVLLRARAFALHAQRIAMPAQHSVINAAR